MRIKIIFILLFILLFMLAGFVYGAIPPEERAALIALYNSTNGDDWTNRDGWKKGDNFSGSGSEGTWYGITVVDDHVISVDLNKNNLVGTIPAELGNLIYLKRLYLYNNRLTGSIPAALGNLSDLSGLSLVFNQLSGEIPRELGNLSNLKWLYLYQNQLTGSIPGELGKLKMLVELFLNDNQLSGNIPPSLGSIQNLQKLYLSGNQLTGSIPAELGNLSISNFVSIYLNNNLLTGGIPSELGNLSNLQKLYLGNNELDGTVPPELGNLSKLVELYLNGNRLSGNIPSQLGNLSNLKTLHLSGNQLTGSIPPALGNLSNLVGLYLNGNKLDGTIPSELGNLSNLQKLYLDGNQLKKDPLKQSIPVELSNLKKLTILSIGTNNLDGNIPPDLKELSELLVLRLNSNRLQGRIPVNIRYLIGLLDDFSDFRWNALYSDDNLVKIFLNLKQVGGNWETTQTIAAKDVKAQALSANSIEVSWTPILYSVDPGGYEVFYSLDKGGPYTKFGDTTTKKDSRLEVTGLIPNTTYYFVVQTRTDPHANNKNTVLSEISTEVSAITIDVDKTISGKVTDAAGVGMEGVMLTFSSSSSTGTATEEKKVISKADGTYECKIHHGWKVTVTPSKDNSLFSPRYTEYQEVTENKSDQDYHLILSLSLSATWEEDKTTLMKIYYGKISLSYSLINSQDLAVNKFIIYRKISGGDYIEIKKFPNPVDKVSGELSYNDKYLDKNKTYTYIARAVDNVDNVLLESNEITIAANE